MVDFQNFYSFYNLRYMIYLDILNLCQSIYKFNIISYDFYNIIIVNFKRIII